jgi:hypothetical protein
MSRIKMNFFLRQKSALVMALSVITGLILTTILVFADGSNYTNTTPAKDSTITTSNPAISTYVISTNELNDQTVKMQLNGAQVTPTFKYKGKMVKDYYEGYIWQVLDRREGTISFNASNLKDGSNAVDVSIVDKAGNTLNNNWSFTVAEPPKFDSISPADKSEQLHVNQLTATVSDNSGVDWDTVKLKINNSYVDTAKLEINRENGAITYNYNFPTGSYTAVLEAKDAAGNTGTKTWTFVADTAPPDIAYLSGFKDGMTITDGKINFGTKLTDLVNIKNNVSLSLDGNPLNFDFRFEGYTDKYYGTYIITSQKIAYISYGGIVSNGNHTLTLYSEDKLGNSVTREWKFFVATKPVITDETPITYGVENLKPTISASIKSPNGTVNAAGIDLKVDGVSVAYQYDEATGKITYTPSENLKNESYHTVSLTMADQTDLSLSKEWKFYTSTYKDMDDSNVSSCVACHEVVDSGIQGVKGHNGFSGSHSKNRCSDCHSYISYPAGCSQCHSDPDGESFDYAPHGSTPTIKYGATGFDPYFPIRVKQNRDMVDCVLCHQPGSGVKGYNGFDATPTRLLNNHDIPELHKTTEESCTECHAKSLTHEHARDGRTDKDNTPITCNTCHKSTSPQVVKAIADKNTACSTCHTNADHDSLHVSDVSTNCTSCHSNLLNQEHKNRNLTCDTCHKSQDSKVLAAFENKDKSCQSCHTVIHKDQHSQCATCHTKSSSVLEVPK